MRNKKTPVRESLLRRNKYLKNPNMREAMTLRSVRNSCAVEGLRLPRVPKRSTS